MHHEAIGGEGEASPAHLDCGAVVEAGRVRPQHGQEEALDELLHEPPAPAVGHLDGLVAQRARTGEGKGIGGHGTIRIRPQASSARMRPATSGTAAATSGLSPKRMSCGQAMEMA